MSSPRALSVALSALSALWLVGALLPRGRGAWDDWWLRAAVEGKPTLGAITRWDLFRFADGRPEHLHLDVGPAPWFVVPSLKLALFRPLSVLTHNLDGALWGVTSFGAGLHSMLWLVGLTIVAFRVFSRSLPARTAGIAILVFALAGTHLEPVSWISARNALVAAALGFLALRLHIDARKSGRRGPYGLASLCFALALLGGEVALSVLMYLVAFELLGRSDALAVRVRAILPYGLLAVLWLVLYLALGYGTRGSGLYLNPLNEPLAFFAALPARLSGLVGGAVLGVPTTLWFFRPDLHVPIALSGLVALAVVAWAMRPALRSEQARDTGNLTWLAAGSLLSMAPQCAGSLGARSLLVPSLGASAVVAACLAHGSVPSLRGAARLTQHAAIATLFVVHFVAAPITWLSLDYLYWGAFRGEEAALARSDLADLTGRHVVVLASTDPMFAVYVPSRLEVEGRAAPASWHALSFAPVDHRVRRISATELELEQLAEPPPNFEQAFRAESTPYRSGEHAHLGFFEARVLEGQGRWRKRVRFAFPAGLDAPDLVFLAWKDGALRRVTLPEVGQTLMLPRENGPWNLL